MFDDDFMNGKSQSEQSVRDKALALIQKAQAQDSDNDSFSIGESDDEESEIRRVDDNKRTDDDEVDDFLQVLRVMK